ncbi:MAG: hypothetical protein QNJ45_23915 [Ardenticatenaceae bacterium]|nr:hypothetical protein [Ardenticatenaceae bacterium]
MITQTELAIQLALDLFGSPETSEWLTAEPPAVELPDGVDSVIGDLIGHGLMATLKRTFGDMDAAEARIERMMAKYPDGWTCRNEQMVGAIPQDRFEMGPIWNAFRYLRPSALLPQGDTRLYESHCDELLRRVVEFEQTADYVHHNRASMLIRVLAPATGAELIGGFVEASMATPLRALGVACYYQLFKQIFPAEAAEIWPQPPHELWPGQAEGEIQRLKGKYPQTRC